MDSATYKLSLGELERRLSQCEEGFDRARTGLEVMEHFIDVYVPIRITMEIQ